MVVALVLPGGKPRETVSGYLGRMSAHSRAARVAAAVVDLVCWWDPEHCATVAREERAARREHRYQ